MEACVTLSKKNYGLLFVLAALLIIGGCKKKETAPPPPPPPPPAAPTASLSANPDSVTPGQATTLSWHGKCQRRLYRRHRQGRSQRITIGDAASFDHLSPDREGSG